MLAVSGSGAAFSPNLPIYTVFRFLCGCSISGISLSTVILSEPQWGPKQQGFGEQQSKAERVGLVNPKAYLWFLETLLNFATITNIMTVAKKL